MVTGGTRVTKEFNLKKLFREYGFLFNLSCENCKENRDKIICFLKDIEALLNQKEEINLSEYKKKLFKKEVKESV